MNEIQENLGSLEKLQTGFDQMREAQLADPMPRLETRRDRLQRLLKGLEVREEDFTQSILTDFGQRSAFEMANYDFTEVEEIKINLVFYGKENRLCNVDAIISRRNYGNTLQNKKRTLYYFQSDKIPNEGSSWTDWKIYMISNISL